MKRTTLLQISFLTLLLSVFAINAQAQGFTVHAKDGTTTEFLHENVDSIVFATVDDPSITLTPGKAVDLGLSVKWASYNVGATAPEEYGAYYSWGELEEKDRYDWDTYQHYDNQTGYVDIGSNISGTKFDVAHIKWGGSWRIPTLDEMIELNEKCTWEWTTYNGISGYKVIGPNGNSIFLSAGGVCLGSEMRHVDSYGNYWTSTLCENNSNGSYHFYFDNEYRLPAGDNDRYYGRKVRPVSD